MENKFNLGRDMILLDQQEKFVNVVSEVFEGDFHPDNPKLNLVGEYSKSVGCGDLDSVILYDIAHEKEHQRLCMFGHMVNPFWGNYQVDHTNLGSNEKFLIFLKVISEVHNIYNKDIREEIFYAMCARLGISVSETERLDNGKMWHDFYLKGFVKFAMRLMKHDSQGLYY